jgi:V/A-type H+-transporting ATPase subunit C
MDTRYYYSASRIKSLESTLLSEVQLERLLGSKDTEEAYKVMHDTFLAPYITDPRKTNLPRVFRKCITNTKNLLTSIAPEPELMDFLWVRYDYYNLKTIAKGKKAGLSDEEIVEKCYFAGKHEPEKLLQLINKGELQHISLEFQRAYDQSMSAKQVYEIDIIMNLSYFRTLSQWLQDTKNIFVHEYVQLVTDMYNLKTQLRIHALKESIEFPDVFAPGGMIPFFEMTTKEQIFEGLMRYGGNDHWKEALEEYEKNGHYSMIEKASDDYIVLFLKQKSIDIFSPATLFAFFRARKNNIDVIKTIVVAKDSGIKEGELRFMLRRLYV